MKCCSNKNTNAEECTEPRAECTVFPLQVTVLRSSTSWYVAEHSPHYTSITVPQAQPQNIESQEFMAHFLKKSLEIQRGKGSPWAFLQFCGNLFRYKYTPKAGLTEPKPHSSPKQWN